jgi:hypothetical protein
VAKSGTRFFDPSRRGGTMMWSLDDDMAARQLTTSIDAGGLR